jgi:hypothetical protein
MAGQYDVSPLPDQQLKGWGHSTLVKSMAGQYDVSPLPDQHLKGKGTLYLGLEYGRAV